MSARGPPFVSRPRRLDEVLPTISRVPKPPAIVVGLCTHGLANVRSLSRQGIPVIALESNWDQPSARTRLGWKVSLDALEGPPLHAALDAIAAASPRKPVLYVTNDRMVRDLNARQEHWRERYHLLFPRADLLSELIEKDTLAPLAERQGMKLPRSWSVSGAEARGELPSATLDDIPYPCIAKPATPMSAIKVLRPASRASLAESAKRHPEIERFIVQEWIPGDDEQVYFTAYYFDRDGAVRWPFAGQKIRQVPRTLGNSTSARGVDRPDLVEEGLKLFRGLEYRGVASVEFKLAPDGSPFFIEATVGRSDFWLKTLIVNGVDLPALVYSDLTGEPVRAASRQRNRFAWVDGDRDLGVFVESLLDPAIPRGRILRHVLEPKRFALFEWGDPLPYVAWLGRFGRRLLDAAGRRLRGPTPASPPA